MAHRFEVKAAADLASVSYKGKKNKSLKDVILHSLDENDVQAYFIKGNILLIPGSNSIGDYLKFNLRPWRVGGKKYKLSDESTEKGHSGTTWHQGFLTHAKAIHDWLERENLKPDYIIGHSLGAAATQILVRTYGVPGIAFAAPRPKRHEGKILHSDLCLCFNRDDDTVCTLPSAFYHMGMVHEAKEKKRRAGFDHRMKHYNRVISEQLADGKLKKYWP